MTLRFRPLWGFTLICAPLFAVLVGLGIWQLERLQWKLALLAQIRRNMAATPINLETAIELGDRAQYRRVTLTGRFENRMEDYFYTSGPAGGPVYHVLTPLRLSDNRAVMIDRGFISLNQKSPASRPDSQVQGKVTITGVWRLPDRPGMFTPAPDLTHRVWFARDLDAMARLDRLRLATPAILEVVASSHSRRWPRGGQTRVSLPNDHLQYALTWFLLAGALLVVYIAFHRARGRLVFGSGL